MARLNALHEALHDLPETWAQHLEGSYVPADELRRLPKVGTGLPPPHAYPFLFLNNGAQSLERSDHDNTRVVRWILRERGITLVGPEPGELIDPVAPDELRAEVRDVTRRFGDELLGGKVAIDALWRQGGTVLLYCRMLQSLATGTVVSKPASVAWARANLPPVWIPLVDRAWSQRARYPRGQGAPVAHRALGPEPDEVARTLDFVRFAIERAERIWSPSAPGL